MNNDRCIDEVKKDIAEVMPGGTRAHEQVYSEEVEM